MSSTIEAQRTYAAVVSAAHRLQRSYWRLYRALVRCAVLDQLEDQLRYAEEMRDEYAGQEHPVLKRLHREWCEYIVKQRARIALMRGA